MKKEAITFLKVVYWDHQACRNIGLSQTKRMSGSCWIEVGPGQFDIDLFFIYFLKLWTGWLPLQKKKKKTASISMKSGVAYCWDAHQNPVVVSKLQPKNWACGLELSGTVQSCTSSCVQQWKGFFGLYSHCFGAGGLPSRRGSPVSFGSSGAETVVVVVQDRRGSF